MNFKKNKYDNVDFEKASKDLKNDIINGGFYNYVDDIQISANLKRKTINFIAITTDDKLDKITANDLIDTLIRRYVNMLPHELKEKTKPLTKEYYGNLYDDFNINYRVIVNDNKGNGLYDITNGIIEKGSHEQLER